MIASCGHEIIDGDGPWAGAWPVWWVEEGVDYDGPFTADVTAVYCAACRRRGLAGGWLFDVTMERVDDEQEVDHA